MNLSANRLLETLKGLPSADLAYVALSGGVDSCVLIHLLVSIRQVLPWSFQAIHVNHGLQEEADRWQEFCESLCAEYQVPVQTVSLGLRPKPGESLEAVAREARYKAIAGVMGAGALVLTAQHQDDQAETLLLQLLRGSGPAGIAGMPVVSRFDPGWLARPLLDYSRGSLEDYAEEHQLQWLEDPSNRDLRFDRNFIRREVMPLLKSRWPSAPVTLSRAAGFSGELQSLAKEEAQSDLASVLLQDRSGLSIQALRCLSSVRLRNLLRYWLNQQGASMPHSKKLTRIEQEVVNGRPDAKPQVVWGEWQVRRYRDRLLLSRLPADIVPPSTMIWEDKRQLLLPGELGKLYTEPGSDGISAGRWAEARVEVRFRVGGERCLPAGQAHRRQLKKLFQEWGIPPWERSRLPLIYLDGELAAIPERMVCQPFAALPGENGVRIRWVA
ncbi:MAG: tRNA lysidine(34) synthetase TilS [Candidatus Thiodiazotropha sp. (ex Monitilora ramsayi)]|nr:tRNA lysidine(34) synthetase TilS [Candidatus Thiodiazotropha sp. (ex Monitilora ramsayi)]